MTLRSSRAVGLYDQSLASLVTFGQTLVYARTMAPNEFGLFAMALAAILVAQVLQRTMVVLPMIISQSENSETALHAWWRLNVIVLGLTTAVIALIGLAAWAVVGGSNVVARMCVAVVIALPTTLLYEFVRRVLYVQQRQAGVLRMSAAYFLIQYLGVGAVVMMDGGAWLAMLATAVATGAAAGVGSRALDRQQRPGMPTARALVKRYRSDMSWSLAAALPYMGFNTALPVILGLLSGPVAAGAFTATRLLLAPITVLISAVDSVDKPRAARSLHDGGTAALRSSLLRTMRSLLLLGGGYLLVAAIWSTQILSMLLGAEFTVDLRLAWLWSLVGLLMMLGQPLETGLLVMRRMRWYFWTRLFALLAGMVALLVALQRLGYEAGILSMATAWFVAGGLAVVLLRKAMHVADYPERG